jgi:hypothetical protein
MRSNSLYEFGGFLLMLDPRYDNVRADHRFRRLVKWE